MSNEIEKVDPAGQLAAPLDSWEAELAAQAKEDQAKEATGIPRISHRNGKLTIEKNQVPGNKLPHVVADYVMSKAYYEGEYDPNVQQTPVCYAFGREEKALVPHEASPNKQSDKCDGCPHNAFGTAEKGRGKRCKDERRVLAAIATGDPDSIAQGEFRTYSIPPGSLKNWGQYLNKVPDVDPRTKNVRAVLTELSAEDAPAGYRLTFKPLARLAPEQIQVLQRRAKELVNQLMLPYPEIAAGAAEGESGEAEAPKKKSKKY